MIFEAGKQTSEVHFKRQSRTLQARERYRRRPGCQAASLALLQKFEG